MTGPAPGFTYSDVERAELIREVPLPTTAAVLDEIAARHHFADRTALREAMPRLVPLQLEICAMSIFDGVPAEARRRTIQKDMVIVQRIAKSARKLRQDLETPTLSYPSFATLFWLLDPSTTLDKLTELVEKAKFAETMLSLTHGSDMFAGNGWPDLNYFVSDAVSCWEGWTGRSAGRGKTGSPAARFVCAAVNPLINFAEANRNKLGTIRGGNLIDDAEAGRLIAVSAKALVKDRQG